MKALTAIPLAQIEEARHRIASMVQRTPLLPLPSDDCILLKLENLQPIGSFKIRGAANAMLALPPDTLRNGVYTASAGNMAQGVAWCARSLDIRCDVIVPESAPAVKVKAIEALGGVVHPVPFDRWWQAMLDHGMDGMTGHFVHPFADAAVIAGNATIGVELIEDDPAIDAVVVPWGGGGLACGIASAYRALRPEVPVYAVEVISAAPLTASMAAHQATTITPERSFIDGIGGRSVAAEIWPLAQELLAGVVQVSVAEVAEAVRTLARTARVVAEGAGAAAVAAVLSGRLPHAAHVACIVSGGNIDPRVLADILLDSTTD